MCDASSSLLLSLVSEQATAVLRWSRWERREMFAESSWRMLCGREVAVTMHRRALVEEASFDGRRDAHVIMA